MNAPTEESEFSAAGFSEIWASLRALILEEYAKVDGDSLDAVGPDPKGLVDLIAQRTEHTRALARKQLGELADLASAEVSGWEARLLRLVRQLEATAEPLADRAEQARDHARALADDLSVTGEAMAEEVRRRVPEAEEHLRDNLWSSLATALGLGVILGFLIGFGRGR